jgi:hypothetical protein
MLIPVLFLLIGILLDRLAISVNERAKYKSYERKPQTSLILVSVILVLILILLYLKDKLYW